jgi:putative transposase
LGQIVAYFKYQSSKIINQIRTSPGVPVWQRNYYEHIVCGEAELNRIREYIVNNPERWAEDEENPANMKQNHETN